MSHFVGCRLQMRNGLIIPLPDTRIQISMTCFVASLCQLNSEGIEMSSKSVEEVWINIYGQYLARKFNC